MDRRSFCKVLGFAAGSTLLPGLMVRAPGRAPWDAQYRMAATPLASAVT